MSTADSKLTLETDRPTPLGPTFRHYLNSAIGSVLIGITIPCLLVILRTFQKLRQHHVGVDELFFVATLLCSPLAVVLSAVLMALITPLGQYSTLRYTLFMGALLGTVLAFLNLPGYGVFLIMEDDTYLLERCTLLFAISGASSGCWTAWQAWRSYHPEERSFPQFSLRTLIVIVLLWGAAMAVFQPREWPPPPDYHM